MTEQEYIPLHNYIANKLNQENCWNILQFASEYILDNGLDAERVVEFLYINGGYCDCEVLMNVTPLVASGEAVSSYIEDAINSLDLGSDV